MSAAIRITRAGPLATVQDGGRPGMLAHGISTSGPMDATSFRRAAGWLGGAGSAGIEFTTAGLGFTVEMGPLAAAVDGGAFTLAVNGTQRGWPDRLTLRTGDTVEITPGPAGNYGYLRFDRELDLPLVMGSRSTNLVARLGGLEGRALQPGDRLAFGEPLPRGMSLHPAAASPAEGPIRVTWGLHADLVYAPLRDRFINEPFRISQRLDRMGARLESDVFSTVTELSLLSDAIVPGDIQILGDGEPIVLLRDHQPTGGYPRVATVISADLDRFAQLRPGSIVHFAPVTVQRAQALLRGGR